MRGEPQHQPQFCTLINLQARIPKNHPLRAIKKQVDAALARLSRLWDALYAERGRPSIPPEQLLKA
jgi:transposase